MLDADRIDKKLSKPAEHGSLLCYMPLASESKHTSKGKPAEAIDSSIRVSVFLRDCGRPHSVLPSSSSPSQNLPFGSHFSATDLTHQPHVSDSHSTR